MIDSLTYADPNDELSYWYWRGVRDGYENASFELYLELGVVVRQGESVLTADELASAEPSPSTIHLTVT